MKASRRWDPCGHSPTSSWSTSAQKFARWCERQACPHQRSLHRCVLGSAGRLRQPASNIFRLHGRSNNFGRCFLASRHRRSIAATLSRTFECFRLRHGFHGSAIWVECLRGPLLTRATSGTLTVAGSCDCCCCCGSTTASCWESCRNWSAIKIIFDNKNLECAKAFNLALPRFAVK